MSKILAALVSPAALKVYMALGAAIATFATQAGASGALSPEHAAQLGGLVTALAALLHPAPGL